ncbi:MAG: hypothetical protein LUQ31_08590 [Methanoregula sp.]|nr:hypothetical protein [Methanoregula sp.]
MSESGDIPQILTTYDLSLYVRDVLEKKKINRALDVDYEAGELFISYKEFGYGLSVTIDVFGVWIINELISKENDGVFTQSGNLHKTESTLTVLRAISSWLMDVEENKKGS